MQSHWFLSLYLCIISVPSSHQSLTSIPGSSLTLFLEDATSDEFKRSEDGPLLLKGGGVGGHGARSDASNVRMVPPACYKEHWAAHPFSIHLGGREKRER